jgi:hypothetical protein
MQRCRLKKKEYEGSDFGLVQRCSGTWRQVKDACDRRLAAGGRNRIEDERERGHAATIDGLREEDGSSGMISSVPRWLLLPLLVEEDQGTTAVLFWCSGKVDAVHVDDELETTASAVSLWFAHREEKKVEEKGNGAAAGRRSVS